MSSAATYLVVAALLTAAAADLPGTALTSQPDVASPAAGASPEPPPDGAFVMNPGSGASVGGWTEIGRTPVVRDDDPSLGDLRELAVVGDQLFAVGTVEETSDGPSRHVLLRSADGLAWLPVAVPGTDPIVTELAASSSGVLAGGSVVDQGERRGSLWASMDGETWTEMPAPPFAEVRRIVSADAPLVVVDAGDRPYLWLSDDGGEDWSTSRRLNDFSIARGPGGFLMWRGGGQDETTPTRLLHSPDARDFQEVDLPSALTDGDEAQAGVSIFALDDQWVLVPSEVKLPDSILTSADGLEWEEAPRPVRMLKPVG